MREGWTYKKLGDCLSYIKNGANIKQTKGANGIPITRIETLSGGVFNRDRLGYADIISAEKYSQNILDDGDILMSHINSKAYIGRSVLYKKEDDEQIIHGMNLLRLKVIPSILLPSFLNTSFQSVSFRDEVAKIRKDAVNQSSMAISDLVKILIPVPPLSEQQCIVSELDLLSSIIEKKKAQLKEYDALAQSIFYDMFGDPIENPKGWEKNTVGELSLEMRYGTSRPACEDGKYNYLRMGNLTNEGYLNLDDLKKINIPDNEIEKCIVRRGDVLFNRTNSLELIGKTCLFDLDEPMVIAGYLIRVRFKESILPLYFTRLFNLSEIKKKLRSMAKGAVHQANINAKELASIIIPLPPLSLQQSFASKIEAIERQKALIQQSIIEAETLFNSRMDYWFN